MESGIAAAVIYGTPEEEVSPCEEMRIAFDGDNVLFGGESEAVLGAGAQRLCRRHEVKERFSSSR